MIVHIIIHIRKNKSYFYHYFNRIGIRIFNNKLIIGVQNYMNNSDEKIITNFLICIVMSTTALQNLKLKFNLCMEKQKRQIVYGGKMD